jgi:hypothetical protein
MPSMSYSELARLRRNPSAPASQGVVDDLVEVEGGQHQHARPSRPGHDLPGGADAVEPGHPDVHDHHVGLQFAPAPVM